MTKDQKRLLAQENKRRKKNGEKPLTSLRTPKLDKTKLGNKRNLPNYNYNPRGASTDHIPSVTILTEVENTGRNSVMEKVHRGEITGIEAEEILRKSKCLAPAYSKGAYQYIGSPAAARDAGKKNRG